MQMGSKAGVEKVIENIEGDTMKRSTFHSVLTISVLCVMTSIGGEASTGLAGRSGVWQTRPVEAVLVAPDGAKASIDPGPARCAATG